MTRVTNPNAPCIAIVGATGAVGATLIRLIEERAFAYRELQLVASARSAGRTLTVDGHPYVVRDLDDVDFGTVDVVFFSAGTTTSEKWVSTAVAAGALVIDNTNAYRMDP